MNLIFLGPPGAGKGTQSEKICKEYSLIQLSTGDILRENRKHGTPLGKLAQTFMEQGELVPDKLIIDMIWEKIRDTYTPEGFILDGVPRTISQAESLGGIFKNSGLKLDAVLVLDVPKEELAHRLSARRTCRKCGRTYHMVFSPPDKPDTCNDPCGGELYQRDDDREETVLNRLSVYEKQTFPLIEYYSLLGIMHKIDGLQTIDKVFSDIKKILDSINHKEEMLMGADTL